MMKKMGSLRLVGFYLGLLISPFLDCAAGRAATLVWDPNPANEAVTYYTVSIQPAPEGFLPTLVFTNSFPLALPAGVNFMLSVTATSPAGESPPSSISYFRPLAPEITLQPASKLLAAGDSLELLVEVSGTPPFEFQWKRGATVLPAQTKQTLLIDSITTADLGNYSVQVSNAAGSVESSAATVTVLTRPAIIEQPAIQALPLGSPFQLAVSATGSGPLFYQWYQDSQALPGAQSPTYAVLAATPLHAGSYFVRVTNSVGSAQSDSVLVSVQSPPLILVQPASIDVLVGASFALAVDVQGTLPLAYQWFRNGVALPDARAATLSVSKAAPIDVGNYHVIVTNEFGSVQSASATVNLVGDPPVSAARLTVSLTNTGLVLSGQGLAGATYDLQAADNLTNPNWKTIQAALIADGNGRFEVKIPASDERAFIRTVRQ
jgi:hypothetical protein